MRKKTFISKLENIYLMVIDHHLHMLHARIQRSLDQELGQWLWLLTTLSINLLQGSISAVGAAERASPRHFHIISPYHLPIEWAHKISIIKEREILFDVPKLFRRSQAPPSIRLYRLALPVIKICPSDLRKFFTILDL